MDSSVSDLFSGFTQKIVAYLPSLVAGIVLVGIGALLGWFAKRLVMQVCMLLRLDRMLQRFRWGSGLKSADVRFALYSFVGNIAFFVVVMIFLNDALAVMNLTILSNLVGAGIFFLPKLLTALIIFTVGWMISGWVANSIQNALLKEAIPRATLISRFAKSVLVLFFSTMALTELDIAREVVVIGFTTIIITLGIIAVVFTARSRKGMLDKILQAFPDE